MKNYYNKRTRSCVKPYKAPETLVQTLLGDFLCNLDNVLTGIIHKLKADLEKNKNIVFNWYKGYLLSESIFFHEEISCFEQTYAIIFKN